MSETIEIFFLGTGGGVPTERRGLPAVVLRHDGHWILFDAGEGVQMRLRQSPLGWGGLEAIFISHLHGDHVLGLPGLLMTLGMSRIEQPLTIYSPAGLEAAMTVLLDSCRVQLPFSVHFKAIPTDGGLLMETPLYQLHAVPLRHRIPCYGFIWRETDQPGRFDVKKAQSLGIPCGPLYGLLQHGNEIVLADGRHIQPDNVLGPPRPGRCVAYCTDTSPTPNIVKYASGADLLIHDATFTTSLEAEAYISGHSTSAQAAQQAIAAGCKQLALTHISARYNDDAPLLQEATAIFSNSFLAYDSLKVRIPARESK